VGLLRRLLLTRSASAAFLFQRNVFLINAGIRGLHGGPGKLASNRKNRLVEHALSTRMVTEVDLALLD